MTIRQRDKSSFRDKSGFVYSIEGTFYRSVEKGYQEEWKKILPFVEKLAAERRVVSFKEVSETKLKLETLPYISYPYEWSFDKFKSAALFTLALQTDALKAGFILKDASNYNIQFIGNRPIFIDHFSFTPYAEGEIWQAYGQFCRHFLAPLTLMAQVDPRLNQLLIEHIDGIPLDLTAALLPIRSRFSPFLQMHIFVQNKGNNSRSQSALAKRKTAVNREYLIYFAEQLSRFIEKLSLKKATSDWCDYYENNSYGDEAIQVKEAIVTDWIGRCEMKTCCLDAGANQGNYSKIAEKQFSSVISIDNDAQCTNRNYLRFEKSEKINSLVIDFLNMSPAIGLMNEERRSFISRSQSDSVLALALIHHLRISGGVPFQKQAELFSMLVKKGGQLIIEYVPKTDQMTKTLLLNREDVFDDYNQSSFENAFNEYFSISEKIAIKGTERVLYLLKGVSET